MRLNAAMGLLFMAIALLPYASGAARFPHPEFESGYELPHTTVPAPRNMMLEYADVAVLAVALILAAYLALRARSRRGIFLLMLFSMLYFGFWRKGCVCAVGASQNMLLAIADSSYAVPLSVVAFFTLPLLSALFVGRTFCAAVCPLGAIQDAALLRPVKVPVWLANGLGLIPYAYLGLVVLYVLTGTGFVICRYDPFVGFFRLSGFTHMLLIGGVILLIGTVIGRPYCRFLCPYGVLLNWMSLLSKWHLAITPNECIQCKLCEDACPFDAIRKPTADAVSETRSSGRRRLGLLLAVLPVLVLAMGWLGSLLEVPLSRLDRSVLLAEQVLREETGQTSETTLASRSFRQTGQPISEVYSKALAGRRHFKLGGWLLGAFMGLVIGCKLIELSVRRTRRDYEPDRSLCFSCGRCFEYCPRHRSRHATELKRK